MRHLRAYTFAAWLLALSFAGLFSMVAQATNLTFVSDLITSSQPADTANHTITFTINKPIPPSGVITLTPEDGTFTIPPGYDYTNVDFGVWDGSSYISQTLAASPSGGAIGAQVVTGTSGSITFTLSSSLGLSSGDKVRVELPGIQNPTDVRSYRIDILTYDSAMSLLDVGEAMIAVVAPVTLEVPLSNIVPVPYNLLPSGLLAAGNPTIEISFNTDWPSTCRYSLTPGASYASMTNQMPQTDSLLFYKVLTGFQDNTSYDFYIRCKMTNGGGTDTVDYPISFSLAPTPSSNSSVAQPSSSGGPSGVGSFPNGSAVLYLANVNLSGFTSPGSTVEILKDGTQVLATQAQGDGSFHANLSGLERGSYGFLVYSVDTSQRKSASYSASLSVAAGTANAISNIVIPPSISLAETSIVVGASATVTGSAPPNSFITLTVTPQGSSGSTQTLNATSSGSGAWSITTDSLSGGGYVFKARALVGSTQSDYSVPVFLGVGQAAVSKGGGGKSDVNGDGKVNLVDFSILLSAWGTSNPSTDFNGDGTTNLADFSILLFNWTG